MATFMIKNSADGINKGWKLRSCKIILFMKRAKLGGYNCIYDNPLSAGIVSYCESPPFPVNIPYVSSRIKIPIIQCK